MFEGHFQALGHYNLDIFDAVYDNMLWKILQCCHEDCEAITLNVEKIYGGKVCAALA